MNGIHSRPGAASSTPRLQSAKPPHARAIFDRKRTPLKNLINPAIWIGFLLVPAIVHAEWLGRRDEIHTIKAFDQKNRIITLAGKFGPIHAWTENIRKERPNGSSTTASLKDLQPGVRIRAFGSYSSSPQGFVARKIFIQTK